MKYISTLHLSRTLKIQSSGNSKQEAIKNALRAGYCGEIEPERVLAFCNRYTEAVTVKEVRG